MLPEREPIKTVIHAIQAGDEAPYPAPGPLESSLVDDGHLTEEDAVLKLSLSIRLFLINIEFLPLSCFSHVFGQHESPKLTEPQIYDLNVFRQSKLSPSPRLARTNQAIRIHTGQPNLVTTWLRLRDLRRGDYDLVYTMSGVYHEVGQLSADAAGAVNHANPALNVYAGSVTLDRCEESRLVSINPNRHQFATVKTRSRPLHDCNDCQYSTPIRRS
ncbi:hypothetical protein QAD02_001974 [Eretmocerus hayati]|uniref:Uncharacterized protein n=1 Tax=Eretmocerus hayati TaxID=131215 RepID=A0ACC2NHS8_9HYME|nr:hypothetical protein QAD02_001974 [Eretmocerus hayati]